VGDINIDNIYANLSINHMREFVSLAGCLNFNRAANELYISSPTLTRHINSIEEAMGVKLLKRSSHFVELTPCGRLAIDYFVNIIAQFDELQAQMHSLAHNSSTELTFGMLYYGFGQKYAYPIINEFRERYPGIKLSVVSTKPNQIIERLKNGMIDIALTLSSRFEKQEICEYHHLAQERLYAIMLPGHPLACKQSVSLEDLAKENILMMRMEKMHETHIRMLFNFHNIAIKSVIYTEHIDTVAMSLNEMNSVFIGTLMLNDLAPRSLVFVEIDSEGFDIDIDIVHLKNNKNSDVAKMVSCAQSAIRH
jgi:DNA-binding transcriptional LysR family regulator